MNNNHVNRRKEGRKESPSPGEIRELINESGLTVEQFSGLVYCSWRSGHDWLSGKTRMHPAFWELAKIKLNKLST